LTDELALIERVRSFIEFGRDKFDCLDTQHPPIERPLGYIRKGEYWILAATWREVLFCGDEVKAVRAAQAMRGRGFLRLQEHAANEDHTLQCTVRIRSAVERAYVIKKTLLDTAPLDREGVFLKTVALSVIFYPYKMGLDPLISLPFTLPTKTLLCQPSPSKVLVWLTPTASRFFLPPLTRPTGTMPKSSVRRTRKREQLQSLINELREANARHRADEMRWRLQAPQIDPVSDK
jgi:hypothetical protein